MDSLNPQPWFNSDSVQMEPNGPLLVRLVTYLAARVDNPHTKCTSARPAHSWIIIQALSGPLMHSLNISTTVCAAHNIHLAVVPPLMNYLSIIVCDRVGRRSDWLSTSGSADHQRFLSGVQVITKLNDRIDPDKGYSTSWSFYHLIRLL